MQHAKVTSNTEALEAELLCRQSFCQQLGFSRVLCIAVEFKSVQQSSPAFLLQVEEEEFAAYVSEYGSLRSDARTYLHAC